MLVVANFGGGVNSTAMLIEAANRGERYDLALFADTGSEHPLTYLFRNRLNAYLVDRGFPGIHTVSNYIRPDGSVHHYRTLEDECLGNETLPSLAYGFRGCSRKWKVQPMDRYLKHVYPGQRFMRWIGYDADEGHRSEIPRDDLCDYRYPLREWGMGRSACVEVIRNSGLPVPHKSACWFCPATKKSEVLALKREHPDLFDRAVNIERVAAPSNCTVAGLGRSWSWERLARANDEQMSLWPDIVEPCVYCWDGGGDGGGGE